MWPQRRRIDTLTTLLLVFTHASASHALSGGATSAPVVLDSRPPLINIVYPVGNEGFQPAEVETLQWTIQEDSYGVNPHAIELSIVAGDSSIWSYSLNPGGTTAYSLPWSVINHNAPQAIFVVQSRDDFGWASAESSAAFSIYGNPTAIPTGESGPTALAEQTGLGPITPNPFNPATELKFSLQQEAVIELALFDLTGRRIVVLTRGAWPAGRHSLRWDGRDADGRAAASGTYLARLQVQTSGSTVAHVKRLTLLK